MQRRSDGPVVLPRRLWALARAAKVTIDVADPLSVREADVGWLAGSHRGLVLSAARVVASMARHPAGMLSSLRAPHSVADVAIE